MDSSRKIGGKAIDLSLEIFPGAPTFPGDPDCAFRVHDAVASSGYNLTRVCFGTHQGTHLDAPRHYRDDGQTVDRIVLDRCVGAATVVDLSYKRPGDSIDLDDLRPYEAAIRPGARILFRLGWDRLFSTESYFTAYPGLTPALAEWLASREVYLIGTDAPGPSVADAKEVHLILLRADIVIVEALANLDSLPEEVFFAAAPLKLKGLDGSPVRAFAVIPEDPAGPIDRVGQGKATPGGA